MTLLEQLERHEGRRRFPYQDTVGKWTVGIGRNLSDRGLSDDEIDYLLMNDVLECRTDLQGYEWWSRTDETRRNVLLEMRFQLGPKGFRAFKRVLASVALGDYVTAAEQMAQSKVAREQAPKRWQTLCRQMATGIY